MHFWGTSCLVSRMSEMTSARRFYCYCILLKERGEACRHCSKHINSPNYLPRRVTSMQYRNYDFRYSLNLSGWHCLKCCQEKSHFHRSLEIQKDLNVVRIWNLGRPSCRGSTSKWNVDSTFFTLRQTRKEVQWLVSNWHFVKFVATILIPQPGSRQLNCC